MQYKNKAIIVCLDISSQVGPKTMRMFFSGSGKKVIFLSNCVDEKV